MTDISIVSGTFNRLDYLKRMIESARASLSPQGEYFHAVPPTHEFVIVDGGSTDGTIEWCKSQSDIRLIEHGKLMGAVKAFNDGAYAAKGFYVILANDDIEFVDDGIYRAWVFMQERPNCALGCFFQDRNYQDNDESQKWHVEEMPVIINGEQSRRPYGQVAIVRKYIGDRVGWWGDYLHTYGGDNELSCNIYAAGYEVLPLYHGSGPSRTWIQSRDDGSCIHDSEPNDALRKINNLRGKKDPHAVRGHHPDSYKWGRKWLSSCKKMVGPVLQSAPTFSAPHETKERFLYLPIFEPGWDIQKEQKRGLREALGEKGVVFEYDYMGRGLGINQMVSELRDIISRFQPTICLFQLHNAAMLGHKQIRILRSNSGAWWVNWNGDVWEDNLLSDEGIELARAFDLQLTVNRDVLEKYRQLGVVADYWQIGYEPDGVGHEPRPEDRCDIVFLANGYSPKRRELVRKLRTLPYHFRLWGNGWEDAVGQCTYDFITACRAYRGAKFSIGDSQWPESGFVSNRVMQALAAGGSALCHQWFRDMEHLGLIDGETCIIWRTFDELKEKIEWYLNRDDMRRRVASAGQKLAFTRHSFDRRVEELFSMKPGETEWTNWR